MRWTFPQDFELADKSRVTLVRVLRELSGRRLAAEARRHQDKVFIKLWVGEKDALHNEMEALDQLRNLNIPAASILSSGHLKFDPEGPEVSYLVQSWVNGVDLHIATHPRDPEKARRWLCAYASLLGRLAARNLIHADPHFANFIAADDQLYCVDPSSLRMSSPILGGRRLQKAWFEALAQVDPGHDRHLSEIQAAYESAGGAKVGGFSRLVAGVRTARHKRRGRYFRKLRRTCTVCVEMKLGETRGLRVRTADERDIARVMAPWLGFSDRRVENRPPFAPELEVISFAPRGRLGGEPLAFQAWEWAHWLSLHQVSTPPPMAVLVGSRGADGRPSFFVRETRDLKPLSSAFENASASLRDRLIRQTIETLRRLKALDLWFKTPGSHLGVQRGLITVIQPEALSANASAESRTQLDGLDLPMVIKSAVFEDFAANESPVQE